LGLLSTSSELNGPASAQRHAHHHSWPSYKKWSEWD
jgi:hypothetical protein